jgi:hypothetical protein
MTHTNQPPLEDVLDMLLVTYGEPTPQAIADFAERYPAYRSDLMEFAVEWTEETYLPEPAPLSADQVALVFSRAQSTFQNLAFQQANAAAPVIEARASLAELAKRASKTLGDVMEAAGMDHGLISKLNGRRIRAETIPRWIARRIADFLGVSADRVTASWTGRPAALAMSFHARKAPVMAHQEDFDIAVAKSSLSEEEKAKLLKDD